MSRVHRLIAILVVGGSALCAGCKSPMLTVMTFNIRYDTPSDGSNAWPLRQAFVAETIKKYDPDVLGLQEVLVHQRDALVADISNYDCVGVGRDDGKDKGEFSPILIKRQRFTVVEKGWFWLSETPDRPGSKGWDAACPRIATWVRLRDGLTRGEFLVLNTHFDHRGETARLESARAIAAFLKRHDQVPQVVMGDFNCGPKSEAHQLLLQAGGARPLNDAFAEIVGDETDAGTFNGFEGVRTGPRIDWILHSADFVPIMCEINRDSRIERYPSDHFPVVARFRITRGQ